MIKFIFWEESSVKMSGEITVWCWGPLILYGYCDFGFDFDW